VLNGGGVWVLLCVVGFSFVLSVEGVVLLVCFCEGGGGWLCVGCGLFVCLFGLGLVVFLWLVLEVVLRGFGVWVCVGLWNVL
jgi:hypothetical protein